MTYPVLAGAVVLTTANRRLRFREAAGAVGNVDLDVGTYYLRGSYTVNLLAYSEDYGNAAWIKANASITSSTETAPNGTATARVITESAANAPHFIASFLSLTAQAHTFSFYAKPKERSWIAAELNDGVTPAQCWFNLSSGTIGTKNPLLTASIISVGEGWYRCSISRTYSTPPAGAQTLLILADVDNNFIYAGDGTSGIYVWGAQVEASSSANVYVSTSGSASGPRDELAYQIKTKLDAFGAGGNTYDVTMSRNIDPASPHSRMTITRSAGTSTFGLVVDGNQTFDMNLIGFPASTLNDANAKTSPFACAANWVSNDIPREIESFSERVVAVPRAVSGRVQGVTRSSRMQSWRVGLAFVDRRRMLIEEALDGAQDTLEGFLERFGATASIEMWLASISSGTTLQGLQSSNLIDVVQASEETLSRFEPQRLGPGVPLYSIDLRLHAKV